jgi:hypothetical protein
LLLLLILVALPLGGVAQDALPQSFAFNGMPVSVLSAGVPTRSQEPTADIAVGPNTLISGVPVTGSITSDDPSDVWTFDGTAGQTIRVAMVALSRGVLDPRLDIALPDGTQVASNDDSGNGEFGSLNAYIDLVQLPEDATYSITATCVGLCQGMYALLLEPSTSTGSSCCGSGPRAPRPRRNTASTGGVRGRRLARPTPMGVAMRRPRGPRPRPTRRPRNCA